MISPRFYIITLFALLFGFASYTDAGMRYASASDTGGSSCPAAYPANDKFTAAKVRPLKGECWSCPKGYKRTELRSPTNEKACKKRKFNMKARKSDIDVKWGACKGKDVWKRNGECWTCPAGYKRSLKKTDKGIPVCKPKLNNKYKYKAAKFRGKTIGACPSGYVRNPLKKADDGKACTKFSKSNTEKTDFINTNLGQLEGVLSSSTDLIDKAGEFKEKIEKVIDKKGIKNLTVRDIRNAGGVELLNRACGKQYGSISVTAGGDGGALLGGNAAGGFAIGLVDECETGQDGNDWIDRNTDIRMAWLASVNVSAGPSAGLDGSITVGFWNARYDKLHGYAHGIVGEGAYGHGATASGWWTIDWAPGKKGSFVGFALGYQAGVGAGIEYNWGYTFQKQTFNNCKNVEVKAKNRTGVEVKVIDVDYHDYDKEIWRSEPTKNTKIANGKNYTSYFNLNQVDHAFTQIRVKYRKKESDGGWSKVKRAWSSKLLCEKDKRYTVYLKR